MRDLIAGVVALGLIGVALSLMTTLHGYRRRRRLARAAEGARGRTIIAELPIADDLVIVSEDDERFFYGETPIDKASIIAVRVLINGSPIAAHLSELHATAAAASRPTSFDDRPEGIARDRWDVAVETLAGTTIIECGAIRERVSQELARAIFDAIRRDVEARDAAATTRSRVPPRAD